MGYPLKCFFLQKGGKKDKFHCLLSRKFPYGLKQFKKSLHGYHPRILEIRHRNPGHVPKGKSGDRKDYFKGLIG